MKALFALAAVSVAMTAVPAEARHYSNMNQCTKWHNHRCVAWRKMTRAQARRARWAVGYNFGPRYRYTAYNSIPHNYVTQYSLSPDSRYVYNGGYIYVVDPKTYAITQVINALTH